MEHSVYGAVVVEEIMTVMVEVVEGWEMCLAKGTEVDTIMVMESEQVEVAEAVVLWVGHMAVDMLKVMVMDERPII